MTKRAPKKSGATIPKGVRNSIVFVSENNSNRILYGVGTVPTYIVEVGTDIGCFYKYLQSKIS